jgi:uncharacterized protein with HEPN domain
MVKDDRVYISHIYDFARKAADYAASINPDDFHADEISRLGVVHLIQNIGEAANHLSKLTLSTSKIDWPQIIGMRNRIVHDYIEVDYSIVWDVARDDLPKLIRLLELEYPYLKS